MEDTHFILDETLEKNKKLLSQLLIDLKHPYFDKNTILLKTFTKALLRASLPESYKKQTSSLQPSKFKQTQLKQMQFKQVQEAPKTILQPEIIQKIIRIPSGVEISPIPIPSTEKILQPEHEFKAIPKYKSKVIKAVRYKEIIPHLTRHTLITDSLTNKPLVKAEIDTSYIIQEPKLNEAEISLLEKLKSKIYKSSEKKLSQRKKLSFLIKKYTKKFSLPYSDEIDSKIRYFLIRDLADLGPITPLLHDDSIKKLTITPDKIITLELDGREIETNLKLTKEQLNKTIYRLSQITKTKLEHDTLETNYKNFRISAVIDKEIDIVK